MSKQFYILFFTFFLFFEGLSQLTPTYVVNIPMRDGKNLSADVYVPTGASKYSTILIQTPYNKTNFRNGLPLGYLQNLNSSPYALVVVDWRGFYGSSLAIVAQPNRGQDGYDVIDWIVAQTWSNGKVGTWGPSALGGVQYNTMKENHPNHICAVPLVAQPQTAYDTYFYGGVLEKSRLAQLDALGYGLSTNVLANPFYSNAWQYTESTTWYPQNIHIPTLQIGGWYDHNVSDMLDWFSASRTLSDVSVRSKQWLLIGPWVHGGTGAAKVGTSIQGELSFPDAEFKCDSMARDFFSFYLLNTANNWESTSAITYYELGKNKWNYSDLNSIETLVTKELKLSENNQLLEGIGLGSSTFLSDPRNPSPTIGGATLNNGLQQGPYNQASLDNRIDLITFSTNDLVADLSVSGKVKLDAYISCNQPDADIAVRLVDVYPDGRSMLINDGIKRLRFRNGYTKADESFMSVGNIYEVVVELPFVNYTWKAGHQLKIYVSGNNSTRWDVNLQNGGIMYSAGDTNTANIQLFHNQQYASKLILPSEKLTLGIEKVISDFDVMVYPNPVKDKLYFKGAVEFETFIILDVFGRKVLKGQFSNAIEVENLHSGVYFIVLNIGNQVRMIKFLKG
jgi:predicted acyl esterase